MPPRDQAHAMTSYDVEELLQRHADALAHGQDITPELIDQNPESAPVLRRLLGLNRRLSESLAPVEPSRSFVSSLRTRLAEAHAIALQEQERHARQMRATIGTGVGALLVIALLARLIGSIIMVIAFMVRLRRRNSVT
jgi:hypothetical protein